MPRPVASASGNLATTPIMIVMTPATRAVVAAIVEPSANGFPSESGPPRMIGLSTMMYAIVKKVTRPPRISVPTVDPRSVILK